ncbi:hypothetical protein OG976_15630 [Mycobacterium sp. NBC_00419]|uniref:hypothetical protein n=1 Tax=Mycobacterium sp. NBC_00419 TaxID=2975989 RepID=UPI002E2418AC
MDSERGGAGEVLRTAGLLLNLTSIIGFALFLGRLGTAGSAQSHAVAAATVTAFVVSLLCLAADAQRDEPSSMASAPSQSLP